MTAARDTRKRASAGRASATLPNLEPEAVWTNRVLRFEADALSRFFEQTFDAVYGVVGAAAVDEA
ncbi:MAG TPA: hypothetical protein VG015_01810, partial [Candidatus Dormibacteraeota bacterium]|nr:hypothetical protein [Candidatus Dormibacteraeota bacterium]